MSIKERRHQLYKRCHELSEGRIPNKNKFINSKLCTYETRCARTPACCLFCHRLLECVGEGKKYCNRLKVLSKIELFELLGTIREESNIR